MIQSKLQSPVPELLEAVRRCDLASFVAAFAEDAVISDLEIEYRGEGIRAWTDQFLSSRPMVQPINAVRRSGATIVTLVISRADEEDLNRALLSDWTLAYRKGKLSSLTIERSISPALPQPAARFVSAVNAFRLPGLLDTFADDAIVNDQLREYSGKAAIRKWAERDVIANNMTMYVVSARERHGTVVVTANVDGEFDRQGLPDPLVLSFYFSFYQDKVIQLIILPKEPDE